MMQRQNQELLKNVDNTKTAVATALTEVIESLTTLIASKQQDQRELKDKIDSPPSSTTDPDLIAFEKMGRDHNISMLNDKAKDIDTLLLVKNQCEGLRRLNKATHESTNHTPDLIKRTGKDIENNLDNIFDKESVQGMQEKIETATKLMRGVAIKATQIDKAIPNVPTQSAEPNPTKQKTSKDSIVTVNPDRLATKNYHQEQSEKKQTAINMNQDSSKQTRINRRTF